METPRKQSETEKAINELYVIFKSSLQSILKVENLNVEVEVVGVKLSTLAVIVEEGQDIELNVIDNTGTFKDETRYYIELGRVSLENRKKTN